MKGTGPAENNSQQAASKEPHQGRKFYGTDTRQCTIIQSDSIAVLSYHGRLDRSV